MRIERIISLAPTHTETLYFLGLERNLVGVTENCDFPEEVKDKNTFGSWAYPDFPKIIEAKPDLVCTFGSHQIEFVNLFEEYNILVFHSDPPDVKTSIEDIRKLGNLTGAENVDLRVQNLDRRLRLVEDKVSGVKRRPGVFRIMNWNPLVTVGHGSFQDDVIKIAGGENIFGDVNRPYFTVSIEDVKNRNPEVIFFCERELKDRINGEPGWKSIKAVQKGRIYCFPCGLTCRSGPRIVDMVEKLAMALHPTIFEARPAQANC